MDWLLTWLWHGVALAFLVSGALRVSRRVGASARYLVWWVALAGVVALGWTGVPGSVAGPAEAVRSAGAPLGPFVLSLPPVPAWLEMSLLGLWMLVAAIGLGRLAAAMTRLRQERRKCRPISADRERRLPMWLSAREAGRRTRLMVSEAASVASVLGFARPVIVLPRRLLTRVTDHELDQIVLHEYAHVQRWDDWARLVQAIVEAVCPFHPAVRWVGRSLDLEREIACDDRVVARTGAPKAYAGCLTRIAEWTPAHPAPALAPGIHGAARMLVPRVERLLASRPYASRATSRVAVVAGAVLVATVVFQLRLLPPLVAERNRAGTAAISQGVSQPLVVTQVASVVSLPGEARRLPPAQSAARTPAATPVVRPAPATAEVAVEVAAEPLPSTTLTPPLGGSIGPVSSGEVSRIDEPESAGSDPAERVVLDSRSPWQKTADAGVAVGARAQESGMAIAGAFTQLGRSLGRAF